jgi:hypothetical protein
MFHDPISDLKSNRRIVYKLPNVKGNSASQEGFGYAYTDPTTALHVRQSIPNPLAGVRRPLNLAFSTQKFLTEFNSDLLPT